jgi:hypothetical protein
LPMSAVAQTAEADPSRPLRVIFCTCFYLPGAIWAPGGSFHGATLRRKFSREIRFGRRLLDTMKPFSGTHETDLKQSGRKPVGNKRRR